jgi:para-aminobenzoate synthetase component 1
MISALKSRITGSNAGTIAEDLGQLDPGRAFSRLSALPRVLFFDSSFSHDRLGRYSFITADPFDWMLPDGERVQASWSATPGPDPLAALQERLRQLALPRMPNLPPFQGGAAGLFSYGLSRCLERLPPPAIDDFGAPVCAIGFYDWVLAFDHVRRRSWLISTGLPEIDPSCRRHRAESRLAEVKRWLASNVSRHSNRPTRQHLPLSALAPAEPVAGLPGLFSNLGRRAYLDRIGRILEYIRAGDCFQVNFAQRLLYPWRSTPVDLYGRLRQASPAPFSAYFDAGDFVIASASPERFLRLQNARVTTRPIKGTRPRGRTRTEDACLIDELRTSAKDRAENIMIVDLLRNDLGRVCRYGSVRVDSACHVETYAQVHHLVSQVRGRLRPGLTPIDLLRATFPGGSVTGAPKIRAMEIIAELEPTARGPYCGCLGYVGFDGTLDTNILIRTFTVGKGWVQFPVGGGIVADSNPIQEYQETWHKAAGLLKALDLHS